MMRAWAAARGLEYEPLGLLPPVIMFKDLAERRARGSENVCLETLPGGVPGRVAHHSFLYRRTDEGQWAAVCDTVVLVHVPGGARVTGGLLGRPQETLGRR